MILGVIQVRLGSTRLPGKALREIAGKPLLWYLCERVSLAKNIDKIVIATSDNSSNVPIVEFAKRHGIDCFAGSEQDLIDRLYKTAIKFGAEAIVRITGDCPLADWELIDRMVGFYRENPCAYDFITNTRPPSFPDGLDLEVIPVTSLQKAWNEIRDPFWREWFTSFISEHPEIFRIVNIANSEDLSHLRWTVDYEEDFQFVNEIFTRLYSQNKGFVMRDILQLLEKVPGLGRINSKHTRNEAYSQAKEAEKK